MGGEKKKIMEDGSDFRVRRIIEANIGVHVIISDSCPTRRPDRVGKSGGCYNGKEAGYACFRNSAADERDERDHSYELSCNTLYDGDLKRCAFELYGRREDNINQVNLLKGSRSVICKIERFGGTTPRCLYALDLSDETIHGKTSEDRLALQEDNVYFRGPHVHSIRGSAFFLLPRMSEATNR